MNANLSTALIITLLGMGLVFAVIVLMWGLLAALVHITNGQNGKAANGNHKAERLRKQRAAAAAVSIALAQKSLEDRPQEFPLPDTAIVSAWQAVLRSNILDKRGNVR